MRRHLGEGFGEVEIVAELGSGFLLALTDLGNETSVAPELLAQGTDQVGILGESLDQDGARAFERRRRRGNVLVRRDEWLGPDRGLDGRILEQEVGERFQARLLGDLGFGAALGLVGQVDVLEAALAVGRQDRRFELGIQLPLVPDGIEDDLPPGLQLAQVAQPLLERTQLRIVQGTGDLLAVARDEGDGGSSIE